jgi:hypothetical protein
VQLYVYAVVAAEVGEADKGNGNCNGNDTEDGIDGECSNNITVLIYNMI